MNNQEYTNKTELELTDEVVLNRIRNTAAWIMKPGERIGCPLIWAGALLEAAEYLEGRINGGMTQQNVDGTHYHFYEPIQNLTISRS